MSGKSNNAGIYNFDNLNAQTLYIKGKKFQEYLDELGSGLTAPELAEVKSLLEYLDITGLNSAWSVTNSNINETLRSAITALQTKTANLDTTGLTSASVLNDANKNSALKTAIDTLITDLTALTNRVSTEETNVDNLQTKTANLDTTALTQTSVFTNDNRNSVLKTAIDALSGTPGDVTALAARVTTAEGDIDALEGRATSLEGRATSLEGRATAVENRATTLEGKTRFTSVSNTYFDNNSGTAQPYGIPFGDFDGPTYPIGSFKMEVGPTLVSGNGKSYFEMTHKNLVQHPNFPAGDIAQAQFSDLLRCAGIRSYYRKGATPGIYNLSNETFLQHTDENGDGRVTMKAKVIRILPPDTNSIVEIGRFTEGWSGSDLRLGGRGNQINIGSMQDDELAQGVGDVATKTRIYIGRRPTTGNTGDVLNSQLILRGDVWTGNLNWKDLAVTSPLSLETLIALLSPSGLPSFLFSSLFGGGLAIPKSDVVVMKGTLSKRGDIETSNALSIEKMSIINTSVGNLTPGFTMFFAQHDVTSTQLIGNNRTGVFQGEISLKNYNVVSTGVDFAFTEENDKVNVLSIKGNSGILLHQGASSNNESLDIFNSKSGPIRLFIGADGTRAGTTHGGAYIMRYLEPFGNNLVATGETKVILGSKIGIDSSLASEAYQGDGFGQGKVATDAQLVIEPSTKVDTLRRQGINVRHKTIVNNLPVYTQSIINSDSISTPSVETESLKITANYGGSTTARLYKDSNNALYWNGALVTPSEAQTLGAVMTLGNTASTTLNMNNNGITNVASIQGWNVKDISEGTNITATSASGTYTIANAAPVQNITASTNIGVSIASNTATLTNTAPVQNVVAGSGGISIDYVGTTATISHVGIGGGGGGSQTIHDLNALEEVGAFQQPSSWATNWAITDEVVSLHLDMYCSVDGKVIASASPATGLTSAPVRYSTNYGATFASGNTSAKWRSITGTSSGSKLFATAQQSPSPYLYYTSTTQGASWTNHNINSVTNSFPSPTLNYIRSSGDGTHLIMCDESYQTTTGARIFVSANGGSSWTAKTLTHSANAFARSCAMSRSGRYQYALLLRTFTPTRYSGIHRSDDFGVTWSLMFDDSAINADGAYFDKLECDSTGRYVYVTRYDTLNLAATIPMYQSADFGANWSASPLLISMTDVWVSATGQHIGAVATPQSGATRFYYSIDYGRTYSNTILTTSGAFRCLVGSGDGSTLVLGAVYPSDFGQNSDGKIRVARSTRHFEPAILSWGSFSLNTGTNVENLFQYNFTFAGYPKIDLTQYNIKYEFDCLWNANGSAFGQAFPQLTLNNYSTTEQAVNGTTSQPATTQFSINLTNGGGTFDVVAQDQLYRGKCYTGYIPVTTNGTTYRNRTLMNGEITLQERPFLDSETSITDHSHYAKTIINNFTCNNYVLEKDGVADTEWYLYHHANSGVVGLELSHQMIRGSSVWETGSLIWSGVANSISTGVSGVGFKLMTNVGNNLAYRTGLVKLRLWRVKK